MTITVGGKTTINYLLSPCDFQHTGACIYVHWFCLATFHMHVEKVSSARLIVLSAWGISGTGKSSSVLSGDLRFTWRLCP